MEVNDKLKTMNEGEVMSWIEELIEKEGFLYSIENHNLDVIMQHIGLDYDPEGDDSINFLKEFDIPKETTNQDLEDAICKASKLHGEGMFLWDRMEAQKTLWEKYPLN